MHATEVAGDARAAELLSMYEQIERRHMFPFWARGDSAHDDISQLTNGPKPVPHRWSYRDDIQPLLAQSARLISTENTDRRSLILINGPGAARARRCPRCTPPIARTIPTNSCRRTRTRPAPCASA